MSLKESPSSDAWRTRCKVSERQIHWQWCCHDGFGFRRSAHLLGRCVSLELSHAPGSRPETECKLVSIAHARVIFTLFICRNTSKSRTKTWQIYWFSGSRSRPHLANSAALEISSSATSQSRGRSTTTYIDGSSDTYIPQPQRDGRLLLGRRLPCL